MSEKRSRVLRQKKHRERVQLATWLAHKARYENEDEANKRIKELSSLNDEQLLLMVAAVKKAEAGDE